MNDIEAAINDMVEKKLQAMHSKDRDYSEYAAATKKYSKALGVRKGTLDFKIFIYINSGVAVIRLNDGREFSLRRKYNNVLPVTVTPLQSD